MVARTTALITIACLTFGGRAQAQVTRSAPWTAIDAVGYTGFGIGLGYAIALSMQSDTWSLSERQVSVILGSTATGLVTGLVLGHTARSAIAHGRPVGSAHRLMVSAGGVMAGATLGSVAAVALINGDGSGTPLGSDETTATMLTAAGAIAGMFYTSRHQSDFGATTVSVAPYRSAHGGVGLRARMRF